MKKDLLKALAEGGSLSAPARARGVLRATDADMERINALAPSPLRADQVWVFEAVISTNALNSYQDRMAPSSLLNYTRDAQAGSPLLTGHDVSALPVGRSFDARRDVVDGLDAVVVRDYMLRNHSVGGANTDEIARGIQAGTVTDLSIGYGGPGVWWRCSICNRDMFGGDCPHFPGKTYDGELCTAWVEDAHLLEHSLVYAGADPGAMVLKAQRLAAAGRLSAADAEFVESACGVRLENDNNGAPEAGREDSMSARKLLDGLAGALSAEKHGPLVGRLNQIRDAAAEDAAPEAVLGQLAEVISNELEAAQTQLAAWRSATGVEAPAEAKTLAERAVLGDQYRADLTEQALTEGVRVLGNEFDQEAYAGILRAAPVETVKLMRDNWRSLADKALGVAGRQTKPADPGEKHLSEDAQIDEAAKRFARGESL